MAARENARRFAPAFLIFGLVGALSAANLASAAGPEPPKLSIPAPAERKAAPDFKLPTLEGKEFHLADLKGKVVMVNFWATWCGPCRMEIPDFIELQRDLGPKGMEIVGVSLDKHGAKVVAPFAQQQQINYTMLIDGQTISGLYGGVAAIPTTFVLDRQGRVAVMKRGLAPKAFWREVLTSLLAEK